ncbi:MAG TPA: PilZ domain-containing protein [Gemmataceae bacterium]|jgi:hypothetical protein
MRLLRLPGLVSDGDTAILTLSFTVLATAAAGLQLARRPADAAAPAVAAAAEVREVAVGGDLLLPDPDTRRRPYRRVANPTLVRITDPAGAVVRGCVLNSSTVGLHLRVERPIPKGAVVRVQACHAPNGASAAEATVRLCRPMDVLYEVGCQFTAPPRPSVLVLFSRG